MEELIKNREDDLSNGTQHDISEIARECGLPFTVYASSTLWDHWVTPDSEAVKKGETEGNRVRMILQKLIFEIRMYRQTGRMNIMHFSVDLTREGKSEKAELISFLGPVSLDNTNPCITLLMDNEINQDKN